MREAGWVLLLGLAGGNALAQDAPSAQDGPGGNIPAVRAPAPATDAPRPLSDGTNAMDPAITPPKIVEAVAAVYPADVETDGSKGRCLLSLVVGIDGIPEHIHPVNCRSGEAAVAAAIDAVQKSKFAPGHLNEQPVPVHVRVRVVFTADHAPALPAIVDRSLCCNHTTPPKLIYSLDPQYSEEARRIKLQGVVTVSGLVTETGEMTDVQVVKSLGHGLDQKAVEVVSQYRFRPAMKDGKPVAARISVQVNFRLF